MQLIDATRWFRPLRKNLGKKNCELGPEDIERICKTFLDFGESGESKIFENEAFGYWKVTVERPLRLAADLSEEQRDEFFDVCIEAEEVALGMPCMRWGAGWVLGRISTSIGSWTR